MSNLLSVNQKGVSGTDTPRIRSFTYDSLSRLLTATNPETGKISYSYDATGNVLTKTDARGLTTSYAYDALNRVTQKSYNDGVTSTVLYGYDLPSLNFTFPAGNPNPSLQVTLKNTIGRLSAANVPGETNPAGASLYAYSYDAMGRIVNQWVSTPSDATGTSPVFPLSYIYDLAGNVTDLTYPDGRHIQQVWNGAGQLLSSTLADIGGVVQNPSVSYLASATYNPDGSSNVLTLGNGVQQTIAKNNRLQVQGLTVNAPTGLLAGMPLLSHSYCYRGCTTGGTANNGNIWGIMDTLNAANTQGFTYDGLNRIGSFTLGGVLNQQYAIDSFGNLSGMSGSTVLSTFNPATNQINLPCASSSVPGFDAAGNQLCSTDANGAISQYNYDPESRISQIAVAGYTGSPFVNYVYDANGGRIRKNNASGTFTEYVGSGGETLAEFNSDGTWSDYIYAAGQRIARADNFDVRIHLSGTNCSGCGSTDTFAVTQSLSSSIGTVIQTGDILAWRQYQDGVAAGGICLAFNHNTVGTCGALAAADGEPTDDDPRTGAWYQRTASLSAYAGDTISNVQVWNDQGGAPGAWDIYMGDIALVHPDGTVVTLYDRTMNSLTSGNGPAVSNVSIVTEDVPNSSDPTGPTGLNSTTFYLGDHLGSTAMLTSGGGWPVSVSRYMPFGAEITSTANANHYKFTGKERDTESGLDYFGARYYGSNIGRWMSPDVVNVTEERMMNPSSTLNKYAYGANNPLKYVDPDGQDITIFYEAANPFAGSPGHTMLLAYDQSNGNSAVRSFGPDYANGATVLGTIPGTPGTDSFGFQNIKSPDDLRANFSSITIQTTPEEAEAVIAEIKAHPDGNYTILSHNCTTTCSRLLRSIGKTKSHALYPGAFFDALYDQYGHPHATGRIMPHTFANGATYGNLRPGYDPFQLFFNDIPQPKEKVTVTIDTSNMQVIP